MGQGPGTPSEPRLVRLGVNIGLPICSPLLMVTGFAGSIEATIASSINPDPVQLLCLGCRSVFSGAGARRRQSGPPVRRTLGGQPSISQARAAEAVVAEDLNRLGTGGIAIRRAWWESVRECLIFGLGPNGCWFKPNRVFGITSFRPDPVPARLRCMDPAAPGGGSPDAMTWPRGRHAGSLGLGRKLDGSRFFVYEALINEPESDWKLPR